MGSVLFLLSKRDEYSWNTILPGFRLNGSIHHEHHITYTHFLESIQYVLKNSHIKAPDPQLDAVDLPHPPNLGIANGLG